MFKGYKIRLYPTKSQEELIWKHIGCCRYVWNYMLSLEKETYKNKNQHLSGFDLCRVLTQIKKEKEHEWLKEVSNSSLQIICRDLGDAFQSFFNGKTRYPKFKSRKKSNPTYPVRCDSTRFTEKYVILPKLGKVKYKTDFDLPKGFGPKFKNIRLSYVLGKFMLSFSLECENQAQKLTDLSMGIDLGIKNLAIAAFNGKQIIFGNINKSKTMRSLEKRILFTQRSISRKYEHSRKLTGKYTKTKNIIKEEDKLRKLYKRKTNIKMNYLHQTVHSLVSYSPKRIVMESLCLTDMLKNKHLSKKILEQCFYDFIKFMKYKCEWYGIEFVQADRFYPSSKTCSCCGLIKTNLKLSDRVFVCNKCGLTIDRDYNAAINLMMYEAQ